jgi:hypothetical protein
MAETRIWVSARGYEWQVPILSDQPMGRPVESDVRARCVHCGWEIEVVPGFVGFEVGSSRWREGPHDPVPAGRVGARKSTPKQPLTCRSTRPGGSTPRSSARWSGAGLGRGVEHRGDTAALDTTAPGARTLPAATIRGRDNGHDHQPRGTAAQADSRIGIDRASRPV